MRARFARGLLLAALLLALAGCSRPPTELRDRAVRAEKQAKQCFESHNPETAASAADQAEQALEDLSARAQKQPAEEIRRLVEETRAAAVSARTYAVLADEERQCRERLGSLKLTVYRQTRTWACNYGLAGPAAAAEHFASSNSLSAVEQPLARLAWDLVEALERRPAASNSSPDWLGVATQLRAWQTNPPPSLGLLLAPAFALHGMDDFALCEIESIEPTQLGATNTRALYHLERSVLFAVHGWNQTAERDLEQAVALAPLGKAAVLSTQALAVVHTWRASNLVRGGKLNEADRELGSALKAWPENPLLPFVQSERLAAAGERDQAGALLDQRATTTSDPWLAQQMKERARLIRQPGANPTSAFTDARFLLEFTLHFAGTWLEDVPALEKVKTLLEAAKAFGERVASQLP